MDNLNKEFLVYKSDLLETIDRDNEKLYSKMLILESRLENRIDKVEAKIDKVEAKLDAKLDKLTYTVLFAMLVPIIVQIATKYIH